MSHIAVGVVVGWVVGCFTPSLGRIVKAWFVKESKVVTSDVTKKL